ncbi:UNVERIFIED_ORG: putative TIM-barrel fold metal-dependent hydrolase [Martelella mediterranea]
MNKRLEGRDEPILEPDLPIIDAHHHLFDKPAMRYMLEEYLADVNAGHRIVASVYVEASAFHRVDGPEALRPLGEIEFANGIGAMCASGAYGNQRLCAAIVGYADLRMGDDVGWLLDRAQAASPERFRGVRQITMEHPSDLPFKYFFTGRPPEGVFSHPKFRDGVRQLAKRGLTYDATGFHLQLPDIGALADDFPDMPVIVNHMTVAMGLEMNDAERAELFAAWRSALIEVAKRPNVSCKIGGLGMPIWGFGLDEKQGETGYRTLAETWRPFVETAIEAFGPDRCMMESNYPPDSRSCGYVPLWNALKHIVSSASADEKADLFYNTAARVYRMDLPPLDG